jgi:sortase A
MTDDRKPRKPRPKQSGGRKPPARRRSTPASRAEDLSTRRERSTDTRPRRAAAAESQPRPLRRAGIYRVPVLGTIAYVIWPPRSGRPSIKRRVLSWVLAVIAVFGIGMAAYPLAGQFYPPGYRDAVEQLIAWSNFLADLEANKIQGQLATEFASLKDPRHAREGDPLTRLEIPKLGVDVIVVQGTSLSALRAGAGHYPSTPLPGARGNVAIAGHRTTYGRPFLRVDELRRGDTIILTTPVGRYVYKLSRDPWVTDPFDWKVAGPSNDFLLTLTTCHPKGSARERLIVRAALASSGAPAKPAKAA